MFRRSTNRPNRTARRAGVLVGAALAVAALSPTAGAVPEPETRSNHPVRWSRGGGAEAGHLIEGASFRTGATLDGVDVWVKTPGLREGHSYTLWVFWANNPQHCVQSPGDGFLCGAVDAFANPAADVSGVWAGGIASANGEMDHVHAFVAASEYPHDPEAATAYAEWRARNQWAKVPGVFDEGVSGGTGVLADPLGAEYQFVLMDHGPYRPDLYGEAQWTTHDGGCHVGEGDCIEWVSAGAFGNRPWTLGS